MDETIKEIQDKKIGKIIKEAQMKDYTTYKIGGEVGAIVYPKNEEKLIALILLLKKKNVKYKVIGNGSNLIFNDKRYDGIIIKLDLFNELVFTDTVITVGAGYNLRQLAIKTANRGLTGLEFAAGIPGTIGGAIYMNAGAYKSDMGYIVSKIKVLTPNLEIKYLYNRDLEFHYRSSFLKEHPDYICLEATIVLKEGDKAVIKEVINDRKRRRLLTQPLELPSAGSVFRNPPDDFAGRLIEECGLKGKKIGGAMVSLKHANFIVNVGNAKAKEVKDLILLVKEKVKEKFKVELKVEQEFVNWE